MKFRIEATGYLEWKISDGVSECRWEGDPTTPAGFAVLRRAAEQLMGTGNGTLETALSFVQAVQAGATCYGPPVEELQAQAREADHRAANADKILPRITCLGDVQPQAVEWLWPGHIPLGAISLIVGRPGEGKSFLSCDLAARISTGTPWPDGSPCARGSVLYMVAEDTAEHVIRPRLDAHHADVWKCHVLEGGLITTPATPDADGATREMYLSLADLPLIETTLSFRPDTRLLIVDPVGSFLAAKTDAHRDNEVRSVLTPIAKLAERLKLAVLLIAHRRKSGADFADDLVLGSRAFTGIARSVWHLSCDPENPDRRLFLPGKNNLARRQQGYAFSITDDPARLYWERDRIDLSADAGLAAEQSVDHGQRGRPPAARDAAAEWVVMELKNGARPAGEIQEAAESAGYSWSTIKRAAEVVGVVRKPRGFGQGYSWELPQN